MQVSKTMISRASQIEHYLMNGRSLTQEEAKRLDKLFKKEKGKSFADYLEEAKRNEKNNTNRK